MPKGKQLSIEHRRKISIAMKGREFSKEHKANLSKALMGNTVSNITRFKLSKINKGKNHTAETKEKCRLMALGRTHTEEARKKISISHSGKNHYHWNPDRKKVFKNAIARMTTEYRNWRAKVYKRDRYTCKLEDEKCKGKIVAHHIKPWALFPKMRYNVANGITLCAFHHPRTRDEEKKSEQKLLTINLMRT